LTNEPCPGVTFCFLTFEVNKTTGTLSLDY
jgi:hypothetical protein